MGKKVDQVLNDPMARDESVYETETPRRQPKRKPKSQPKKSKKRNRRRFEVDTSSSGSESRSSRSSECASVQDDEFDTL